MTKNNFCDKYSAKINRKFHLSYKKPIEKSNQSLNLTLIDKSIKFSINKKETPNYKSKNNGYQKLFKVRQNLMSRMSFTKPKSQRLNREKVTLKRNLKPKVNMWKNKNREKTLILYLKKEQIQK